MNFILTLLKKKKKQVPDYLEIGLSADYVPSWGLWEGVREIIQNAKDREEETGVKLEIKYNQQREILAVINKNTVLSDKIWTFGYTEKKGTNQRGKWGEGLKLACLALLRDKRSVVVISGNKKYTPAIKKSKVCDHNTLQVLIQETNKNFQDFGVFVSNITPGEWEYLKDKFLFLSDKKTISAGEYGDFILDEKHNLYADGIFVEKDYSILYSYNLKGVSLSRDRDYISSFTKADKIPIIYSRAINKKESLLYLLILFYTSVRNEILGKNQRYKDIDGFYDCIGNNNFLVNLITKTSDIDRNFIKSVFKQVTDKYYDDIYFCKDKREIEDIARFNKKAVVVTKNLYSFAKFLNYELLVEEFFKDVTVNEEKEVPLEELTKKQRDILKRASNIVRKASEGIVSDYDIIVKDYERRVAGLYDNKKVFLDLGHIETLGKTLVTLVHEFAHEKGTDLTSGHIKAIEEIFANIIEDEIKLKKGFFS